MTQEPIKTARITKLLNVGQADVEAEDPIKRLPAYKSIKVEYPRIRRKRLIRAFNPTSPSPLANNFSRFSNILRDCVMQVATGQTMYSVVQTCPSVSFQWLLWVFCVCVRARTS